MSAVPPRLHDSEVTVIETEPRDVYGEPLARMRRHLNGTLWPAFTTLRTPGLSTGALKPTKSNAVTVFVCPAATAVTIPSTVTVNEPPPRFSTLKLPSAFSETFAVTPAGTDTTVRPPPRTTCASPC